MSIFSLTRFANYQGHCRKAEVFYEVQNYKGALECYQKCFQLSMKEKDQFMESVRKCKRDLAKENSLDDQYPFIGAAIGK